MTSVELQQDSNLSEEPRAFSPLRKIVSWNNTHIGLQQDLYRWIFHETVDPSWDKLYTHVEQTQTDLDPACVGGKI